MEREPYIDGLRGLAAFYVVLHHCYLEIWPTWRQPTGVTAALTSWLRWGHLAVAIFIVISGYCLALPLVTRGLQDFSALRFYRRRAFRVLPPYYFGLVLSVLLIVFMIGRPTDTHWDSALPLSSRAFLACLALLPELSGKINHSYWSIGVECWIYVVFPAIVALARGIGVAAALSVTAGISFAVGIVYEGNRIVDQCQVHFLGLFCFGAAAAFIVHSSDALWIRLRRRPQWIAGASTGAVLLAVMGRLWNIPLTLPMLDLLAGIYVVSLVVMCGKATPGPIGRALNWKPWVELGVFSYSLYLIHAPLIQVVWQYTITPFGFSPGIQFIVLAAMSPVIVLFAWLFHRVCERPFLHAPKRTGSVLANTPALPT